MRRTLFLYAAFLLPGCLLAAQPKDVPSWVQEVSSRQTPAYSGRVPAAVLLQEQHVTVDPSGTTTIFTRKAVKILTHDGQNDASAQEHYFAGGRTVKSLRAWIVAPSGFTKTLDKNDTADVGAFGAMELYSDIRVRTIGQTNAEVGAVFAYESQVEEKSLFAQDEYLFQTNLPAVESRYVLTLPSGWTAHATVFNHAPIEPTVDGSTYTWQLADLRFRTHETDAPSIRASVPRLAVDFRPNSGSAAVGTAFQSWTDVSRWHSSLAAGQAEVTPEIAAKSRELTANAKTEYSKVQAIGHFVQNFKYVAIEMDLAHGGGYKPHAAESVFRKQYGDCKDKANLMRAMLKAAGIDSYLVAIFSGDRTFVRDEWPSPSQFNHMIIAVKVTDAAAAPTVLATPKTGSLLIFDPTSEVTPVGDLPWYEQGSFALLCAGDKGDILKMPVIKSEANSTDIQIDAELTGAGELKASLTNSRHGQSADNDRSARLHLDPAVYRRGVEEMLAHTAKSATISKLASDDNFEGNTVKTDLTFSSAAYAQVMQNRMLVFTPAVLDSAAESMPTVTPRTQPIVLRGRTYRKHVRIKLPEGFTVDEMPQPSQLKSEFGQFSLKFSNETGALVVDEEIKVEAVTLPPDQYVQVKKFFDTFAGADRQQAVLIKN